MTNRTDLIVTVAAEEDKGVLGAILRAAGGRLVESLECNGTKSFHVEVAEFKGQIFDTQASMNGYNVYTHPK